MIMIWEIQIVLFVSFEILPGRFMSSFTWNRPSVPQQVKESESLPRLKRRPKVHLLNNK